MGYSAFFIVGPEDCIIMESQCSGGDDHEDTFILVFFNPSVITTSLYISEIVCVVNTVFNWTELSVKARPEIMELPYVT